MTKLIFASCNSCILFRLGDAFIECLPNEDAASFSSQFQLALSCCYDTNLSNVWSYLALWILIEPMYGLAQYDPDHKNEIRQVAHLYERSISGEAILDAEWASAAEQAGLAALDESFGKKRYKEFAASITACLAARVMNQQERIEDFDTSGKDGGLHQSTLINFWNAANEAGGREREFEVMFASRDKFFELIWNAVHSG